MINKEDDKKTSIDNIPMTGRIGRYAKIVKKEVDEETFLKIMSGSEEYKDKNDTDQAAWWKKAIETMEDELGTAESRNIMKQCGAKCCGKGQRETGVRLMKESESVEEFLQKLSKHGVKDAELEYIMIDENKIIGKHNRCFCGQVKASNELFKTDTYCQCSVEFNRQFFESAFERPVEVKLNSSILNGDDWCEFEITILD